MHRFELVYFPIACATALWVDTMDPDPGISRKRDVVTSLR